MNGLIGDCGKLVAEGKKAGRAWYSSPVLSSRKETKRTLAGSMLRPSKNLIALRERRQWASSSLNNSIGNSPMSYFIQPEEVGHWPVAFILVPHFTLSRYGIDRNVEGIPRTGGIGMVEREEAANGETLLSIKIT